MNFIRVLPAVALIPLSACQPVTSPEKAQNSPAVEPSSHFSKVSSELDTGGTFFTYIELEGDVARFTDSIDALTDLVQRHDTQKALPIPSDVKATNFVEPLGLDGIAALGMSSVASNDGNSFLNKTYIYTPGGRKGLLSLGGGTAHPFHALEYAPAGSDVVYEADLDLRALRDIYEEILSLTEEADKTIGSDIGKTIESMSLGFAELLGKTQGRITLIAKTVPEEPFPVPLPSLQDLPAIDLLILLDNVPWLFEEIEKHIPAGEGSPFTREDSESAITYTVDPAQTGDTIYAPLLTFDKSSGQIILASRQAFIDECQSDHPKLSTDPEYIALASELPKEGNSLSYTSNDIANLGQGILSGTLELTLGLAIPPEEIQPALEFWAPGLYHPGISITENREDGILVTSRLPTSHKRALLTFANPASSLLSSFAGSKDLAAIIPGIPSSAPAASPYQPTQSLPQGFVAPPPSDSPSLTTGITDETLTGIYKGLRKFARDNNGFYPTNLHALNPAEHLTQDTAVAILTHRDKIYYRGGLTQASGSDEILVGTAIADQSGYRTAILNNGILKRIPEAEFLERTNYTPKEPAALPVAPALPEEIDIEKTLGEE